MWERITDLPKDWENLSSPELASLSAIWREQSERLRDSNALKEFNNRMAREWAIETGVLEGLYTIDRGTTVLLIEQGIQSSLIPHNATDIPKEELVSFLRDHQNVLEGLFDFVRQKRDLSKSYIKEIHAQLTQTQDTTEALNENGQHVFIDLIKGDWKRTPNNPLRPDGEIHYYCPPEHVETEIENLVEWHLEHQNNNVPPEVEAAWLHHRFTQIHPFQDGNGRVARALATLVLLRAGWFPLVIRRDDRANYIGALERADRGDLSLLVQRFIDQQKRAFLSALSLSEKVLQSVTSETDLLASGAHVLMARFSQHREKQSEVFAVGESVHARILENLERLHKEFEYTFSSVNLSNVSSALIHSTNQNDYWYTRDIIDIANDLQYFADMRSYKKWSRFTIREQRQTDIVFSIHSVGRDFVGILGVSAFIKFTDTEDGEKIVDGPHKICDELFQFAFNEDQDRVLDRFEDWIRSAIVAGLALWQRQL